ncbi:MAG: hypothetical protein J6S57_02605, partial [Alphaproteobacteria bacterium]|nr:hypothetical protein [Alphaproteobacteria bacterium]
VKSFSPKTTTVTPVARTASTRPGSIATTKKTTVKTTATKSDTERFPGIVGKSNVKDLGTLSVVTNPTTSASTSTGYDIREMNERLMNVENSVDKKADKVQLYDYYTKQDIDSNFYTRDQVEDRLGEIDTSASSAYLRTLASQVELHSQQILELSAEQTGLYDQHTNTAQNVYIETDFNENVLDIEDESNEG